MVYQWLYSLADHVSAFNVFRYITVRTFISFFTGFFLCLIWGPKFIQKLKEKHFGQSIRDDGPKTHQKKAGTPTMGGWLILLSTLIPLLLWIDITNPLVIGAVVITWGFGLIGYFDDYLKVSKKNSKGLSGKLRLGAEFLISGATLLILIQYFELSTVVTLPFASAANYEKEFTSLCPKTGQPDFAKVFINYIADKKMVESKSLKMYLFSFRNHGDFHEDCIQTICNDLVQLMKPKYIEVIGEFTPRGGIAIFPFASAANYEKEFQTLYTDRLKNYAPGKYSVKLDRLY